MGWDEGLAEVQRRIELRSAGDEVVIVCVSGPVGAGKTSFARGLGGVVISTDDYLPDYSSVAMHERDDPERADLELLAEHLRELTAGRAAAIPRWSFKEHRRVGHCVVEPGELVVCEGIFALHERVAAGGDVCVFVEASAEARWRRWEEIEETGERGWGAQAAREHFEGVAEPTFAKHAAGYRARADVIVVNDERRTIG